MGFLDRVLLLVKQKQISKNKLLTELGLGKNSFVDWAENGNIPSGATLEKIADYFNVSIDYLIGRTDNPTPGEPALETETLKFALFGTTDITDEVMDDVRRYAEFVAQRKKERGAP